MIVPIVWAFLKKWVSFFLTPPGIYIAAVALAVGIVWFSHHEGYNAGVAFQQSEDQKDSAKIKQAAAAAGAELASTVGNLNYKVSVDLGAANSATVYLVQTQIKEVHDHVTPAIDAAYPLPCGLIRVRDAAVLGTTASALDPSRCGRDDQPAPTKASDLGAAITYDWQYVQDLEHQRDALKATLIGIYDAEDKYDAEMANASK